MFLEYRSQRTAWQSHAHGKLGSASSLRACYTETSKSHARFFLPFAATEVECATAKVNQVRGGLSCRFQGSPPIGRPLFARRTVPHRTLLLLHTPRLNSGVRGSRWHSSARIHSLYPVNQVRHGQRCRWKEVRGRLLLLLSLSCTVFCAIRRAQGSGAIVHRCRDYCERVIWYRRRCWSLVLGLDTPGEPEWLSPKIRLRVKCYQCDVFEWCCQAALPGLPSNSEQGAPLTGAFPHTASCSS